MNKEDKNNPILKHKETVMKFRLIDDVFMSKVFEAVSCTEKLVQVVLKRKDIQIQSVTTQTKLNNIYAKAVVLDIHAVDSNSKKYSIEVQRDSKGADFKRSRYISSMIDAITIEKGTKYDDVDESYIIFITEEDVIGKNLPIYHIHRYIDETHEQIYDGQHIIYVNSQIQDDTELGRLMHDFYCTSPNEMYYNELRERVSYFKETEKGMNTMCEIVQKLIDESVAEKDAQLAEKDAQLAEKDTEIKELKETIKKLQKQ